MVGIFYNYLADLAQRKTFSQTRSYLISLTTIEEQKIKKVCCKGVCTMVMLYTLHSGPSTQLCSSSYNGQ